MRKVVFAINITIDGYCGHESGIADDELHEFFTGLLRDSDIEIFGRNTYQLMYPYWHDVAINQSETKVINEFARTFDAIPKIVFSTTLKSVEWNNTILLRSNLQEEILKLKQQPGKKYFHWCTEHRVASCTMESYRRVSLCRSPDHCRRRSPLIRIGRAAFPGTHRFKYVPLWCCSAAL